MDSIIMPQVGQDVPSAAIVEWLKKEGDPVKKGEPVLVIESDKATFEVEAPSDGVLLKALFEAGDVVEIFKPVAYVGQPGETPVVVEEEISPETAEVAEVAPPEATVEAAVTTATESDGRILSSPAVRKMAREQGLDLSTITGSGPGGRIIVRDVLSVLEFGARGKSEDRSEPFTGMRKRIAEKMTLSVRTIPHFHLFIDVDMTRAMEWREQWNARQDSKVSVTDLVVHAAASALKKHPRLNAHVDERSITLKSDINIGVAVSVEDGLLVPVIPNADRHEIGALASASRSAIAAARRGVMESAAPGTFTITSLGMYGIRQFMPIINPPEAAILAVGSVEPRVIALDGKAQVRQVMTISLAADHRAVDGAYAAQFLKQMKDDLETLSISRMSE